MSADTDALNRIERIARTLRYRRDRSGIGAAELEPFTDAQLASALLAETTTVVVNTMETDH